MRFHGVSFLRRLLKETSGQTMYIMVLGMSSMIGLSGIAVDLGHGYYASQQLQASTNMAAIAAAAVMPDTTTASSNATAYGSGTGDRNATGLLTNVTTTTSFLCLSTLANASTGGVPCIASTGSTSGNFNAVRVIQTAKAPTWFGGMFGLANFNLTSVSTAAMAGGSNTPYNIAIIVDTTASMAAADNGTQCTGTQISCALGGVRSLLQLLFPCTSGAACTAVSGTQQVNNPVDSAALFVFPPVTTATESKDYVCPTSNPTTIPYTFTNVTSGSSQNFNLPTTGSNLGTYEVIPFSGNYKASDTSTSLNSSSYVVIAGGGSGVSGCSGIQAPGGQGTYYAQAIYQAQAALVAQQTAYANAGVQTKNMLIIVSDGDATACNTQTTGSSGCSTNQIEAANCPTITTANGTITSTSPCVSPYSGQPLNGTSYSYTTGSGSNKVTHNIQPAGYQSYAYPSALGECGQAIIAAKSAASAGTKVVTVGYGAENTGCTSDTTYSAYPGITPCQTIQDMASDPQYFFSDDGDGCSSPNQAHLTKLSQIFQYIVGITQTPRLVPNSTT
jgi:hypothetical protein